MSATPSVLAFDLGAESGRAVLGRLDGSRLSVEVIHRFANRPVRTPDGLHWDILALWAEVQEGMALAARSAGGPPAAIGVDTWGSDCALLDRQGTLLANPWHYRDRRTEGMEELAFRSVPRRAIYEVTGNQFMRQNTLLQLLAMARGGSPLLQAAGTLLMIPDLFHYWLSGRKAVEFSGASTTQFYDPRRAAWATDLLDALGVPHHFLPEIVPPGTVLGMLAPWLAAQTGLTEQTAVVAPVTHDTGSAVAATPNTGARFAYVSSGTWSLVGAEVEQPVIAARGLALNVTNEGGIDGTFRYLKNVLGLWLVQECRRTWASRGHNYTYAELTALAGREPPLRSIVDPDDPAFFEPGDMPDRIAEFCRRTGQPAPESPGAVVRCIIESLALKYRWVIESIESILGYRLEPVHILGGGARNTLLNQCTADALGRTLLAGPEEATAIGNVAVQMRSLGWIGSRAEARALIQASFPPVAYQPGDPAPWDAAYARLKAWLGQSAA
jgi:rhamnulokinase